MTILQQAVENWIDYKEQRVRIRYFIDEHYCYINCYTKGDDLFEELKDTLKNKMSFRWERDEKFWYGDITKGQNFIKSLGL